MRRGSLRRTFAGAGPMLGMMAVLATGCGARGGSRTAVPALDGREAVGDPVDRAGALERGRYTDPSGWEAELPAGFEAPARFRLGSAGPPAGDSSGERPAEPPRARFQGTGCIIDLAFEHPPGGEITPEGVARGREVFFFARIDAPQPFSPAEKVWAATSLPADPEVRDVGYWIRFAQPRDEHGAGVLRIEARAAIRALPACKEALDGVVRSVRVTGMRPSVDARGSESSEG